MAAWSIAEQLVCGCRPTDSRCLQEQLYNIGLESGSDRSKVHGGGAGKLFFKMLGEQLY